MLRIIDLSILIQTNMPNFSVLPKVKINKIRSIEKEGDEVRTIFMPSHVGTHIDAPSHQVAGGARIDELPIEKFLGNAIILNYPNKNNCDNTLISLKELERYKNKINENDIIVINTGSYKNPGSFDKFGYISQEAAKFFVDKKISLLAVDSPSVDLNVPEGKKMPVHQIILGAGIPIIEGLTNLDKIKEERFFFIGLPINIKDSDAVPCRAIAIEGLTI